MIKKWFLWILVVLWGIVIFMFSSDEISQSRSKSTKVLNAVESVTSLVKGADSITDKKNTAGMKSFYLKEFIVRKAAHFTEYFILSLLLISALSRNFTDLRKAYVIMLVAVVAFASMDEFHQLFVKGRDASARDVLIDSAGALTAILASRIFCGSRLKPMSNS